MELVMMSGSLKSLKRGQEEISHLLFAYDMLVLCKGNNASVKCLIFFNRISPSKQWATNRQTKEQSFLEQRLQEQIGVGQYTGSQPGLFAN